MRKTLTYGDNRQPFDFEWPKENDLLQMPLNVQLKIKELKYNIYGTRFGAFQVILTNGTSSSVFIAKGYNDQGMKSIDIKDYSLIKRVKGSE